MLKSVKFNVLKPEYVYLKITPNNSVRNQDSYKIARMITSTYKNVLKRITVEEKKLVTFFKKDFFVGTKFSFMQYEKMGYFIYIEKKRIDFYFIVPKHYYSLVVEKITDVWGAVTIKEVDNLPQFSKQAEKYQLVYQKEDALSLDTDRRDNDLLRSNLNVVNVLDENDKVGLFYNFIPILQQTWTPKYNTTINKYKNHKPVDRNKQGITFILKYMLIGLTTIVDEILGAFNDKKKENMFEYWLQKLNGEKQLSPSTDKKRNASIIKAQIVAISDSSDKIRKYNNVKSLTQSFETVAGDNKFIAKRVNNKKLDLTQYMLKGVEANLVSDQECNSFIALAGRDILEEYEFMDQVETKETQVPEELQSGVMLIGENTFRGNKQAAYLSTDKEFQYLSLIVIGPNRAGKSTLFANIGKNALDNNECVVNLDFIKNCELSKELTTAYGNEKVLNIECSSEELMQGLGYNEIEKSDDPFEQYVNAKLQTTQLTTLINSINEEGQPLTSRMERYLQAAANVTFISNGSIKDVFEVLQNPNTRHSFIGKVKQANLDDLQESIDSLYELDEVDAKTGAIIGTKYSRIEGITDRLNKLKQNPYMEKMYKKDCKNNVNLVEEFQKAQLINIKMPETMFSTDNEKDVYATYWITKIQLALQVRGKKYQKREDCKKVNLLIDELYQVESTERFITKKLSRWPKFNIKPIFSCHYLNQLKHLRNELRSASGSYMLIAGCDKDNYKEFKSELYPYEERDLLNLKRHESLNLIKTSDGYAKFITKMPKPLN